MKLPSARVEKLIFKISHMVVGSKRYRSKGTFQAKADWDWSERSKSEIIILGYGCVRWGDGEGVNEVMVGIQLELQIGRKEELWIL
jgi:hypothetical protein